METTSFGLILETDRLARKIYRYYVDKEGLPEEAARKMVEWTFQTSAQFFDPEMVDCALTLSPEAMLSLTEETIFNGAE